MKNILIWWVLLLVPVGLRGQAQAVEHRAVPERQWQKAVEGLDYSQDLPEAEKKKTQRPFEPQANTDAPPPQWNSAFWATFGQILAIAIAVALVGYGIYRMLQEPRNRLIARDGAEITVDNLETYLHETDLDRFLREALAGQHYTLAIRLYFLQIIKALSQSGAINWSKEKTNRDYLREMRAHRLHEPFQQITGTYEQVWYGNTALDAAAFARLEPAFRSLLKSIA